MPCWLSPAGEEVLLASHQAVLGAGSCRWRENCLTMMQTARPATWTRTSRLKRNRSQRPPVVIQPHCFLLSKMTACSTSFFSFNYVGSAVQKEDQWAMYTHTHTNTSTYSLRHKLPSALHFYPHHTKRASTLPCSQYKMLQDSIHTHTS